MRRSNGLRCVDERYVATHADDPLRQHAGTRERVVGRRHDVPVDHLLTYDDVGLDEFSTIVRLRRMQDAMAENGVPALDDLAALLRD